MTTIRFYHSMICPRCFMVGRSLAALRGDFPDVEIEEVEYLTNLGRARKDGVRTIPALVAEDRKLSGFYLTKRSLRTFLESVTASEHEQDLQGAR
jgi:predicted DsbA family dithiol-disulfide isomerase